jgi:predicted Zn-dependent protease
MRTVLLLFLCALLNGQDPAREKEAALGRQMAEKIRRTTTPVANRDVQNYVARLGARLSDGFGFSVVTDDSNALHDPVVVPGGSVFVPVSLLIAAKDEAEFAGMLAQAIARERLPIRVGWFAGFGSSLMPAAAREKQRAVDLEADRLAVQATARAGFDPAGILRYIIRLTPDDEARIAALRQAVPEPVALMRESSGEFNEIQEQVRPAPRVPPSLYSR